MLVSELLIVLLTAFGTLGVTKGEFNLTSSRRVAADVGKAMGGILFAGVALTIVVGYLFGFAALIIAIVIGLTNSKPNGKA
jgi:hypothetical protein